MKKSYYVTALAGREVAGLKNPGVGQPLLLTESQAEHPLRLGYITATAPVVEKPAIKAAGSK